MRITTYTAIDAMNGMIQDFTPQELIEIMIAELCLIILFAVLSNYWKHKYDKLKSNNKRYKKKRSLVK